MIEYKGMTDRELERITNLAELAMGGNKEAFDELADLHGPPYATLGDLTRTMWEASDAMTPLGREDMFNRDSQRAQYMPPIKPDAKKAISKIARLRRERGMTQQALADKAGLNIRYVQRYESGERPVGNMTMGVGVKIADALGVSMEDLIRD